MMANEINGLEEHIQNLVRAQGSNSPVSVIPVDGASCMSACIDLSTRKISFEIPSEWDITQYKPIRDFAKRLKIRKPALKVVSDVALHEVGHNKLKNDADGLGCPEDLIGKELAIDAVTGEMVAAGKFSQHGALYLENCISDIINNLNVSKYSRMNGLGMFFAEQAELNKGKYSPLYEAFVKLNMHLFGTKKQKQLMKHYYTNEKKVDEVVADCLNDVGINGSRKQNLEILFNKEDWHSTFSTFAKHLVKLMDESANEALPGSGGQGYKVPARFDGEGKLDPEDCDDPMLKRVLDTDNMRKVMKRRNDQGESMPAFVENWKALDYLYQALAGEIYIKAETPKKGQSMPIAPIQARQFDTDKDRLEDILFGRILLGEDGKACLAVPRSHVEKQQKYKKSIKSYPELNIAVLDNSGSMTEAANNSGVGRKNIIPWGDNSKYHYSVLAYYGVEKALHRIGVATKTRYNLITFSHKTESSGEKDYEERSQIKRRILEPRFGKTTQIDIKVLAKHARQAGSILMTISDGEIFNWQDIKDEFKRTINDKYYVHFQIGKDTQATQDIESWGGTVIRITDASEMPKRAIDITQKFYKSYAAGEIQ